MTDPKTTDATPDKCDPNCPAHAPHDGPPREAGGTTGSGNVSPGQASRTGGATTGVARDPADRAADRDIPPTA